MQWVSFHQRCSLFFQRLFTFVLEHVRVCDSGWPHCERHRLPDDLTPQAGRHQSQQAWHEPHALRCQGESERPRGRSERFQTEVSSPPLTCFHSPQQVEEIDAELLTFPSQLEHIGAASRWPALHFFAPSKLPQMLCRLRNATFPAVNVARLQDLQRGGHRRLL